MWNKNKRKGLVFVVSGPSGSGKTTLIKRALAKRRFKDRLSRVITYTTRPARAREKNGRDYIFTTKAEFRKKIKNRGFLEWERVLGEYYGTPREQILGGLAAGKDLILCIDVKGARVIRRKRSFCSVLIFILPSQNDWKYTLKKRLKGRSSDSHSQMQKRLKLAEEEVASAKHYDYVLINKDINQAARELVDIIVLEKKG